MSAFTAWLTADPVRVAGGCILVLAVLCLLSLPIALLLGRMIADADHDVYGDDDWPCTYAEHMDAVYSAVPCSKCQPPPDVAHVHDLAAQLANDQAWARATWFPGGQR